MASGNTDLYVYAEFIQNHGTQVDANQELLWRRIVFNIDMYNNALDYDLAKSVGEFFRLNNSKMDRIIEEVLSVVSTWKQVAHSIGISNAEQNLMAHG